MRARHLQSWLRRCLVAGAIALAPQAGGAQAPQSSAPASVPPSPDEEARTLTIGNSVHVLYHLVAQALIDQLALTGPADAQDNVYQLSTILMIAASDDPQEDPILLSAMRGLYRAAAHAERTGARLPFWAERGLDLRRAQSILCAFTASEPDEYRGLADEVGFTEEQRRNCAQEFARLVSVWGPILRPHMSDTGDTRPGRAAAIVAWSPLEGRLGEAVRPLRESRAVEQVAEDMTIGLRLTSDLVIRLEPCGQVRAQWDPQRRVVVVCYELVEAYAQIMSTEERDRPRP